MSQEIDVAQRYRARAEELRKIADEDEDEATRRTLRRIANDYEGMAESFIAIDRTNRSVRKFQ